jgi:site-specific recombinase XerD
MFNPTLQELAETYIQHCSVIRNYSPYTIKGYKAVFRLFFMETTVEYPKDLNLKIFEAWFFNGRLNRKWSSVTFRGYLKPLNTFMKWLVKEECISENYLEKLEKPRMEHKLPRTLSKEQATRLLEYSFNMHYPYRFSKYRNRAIVAIMVMAGLRRKEVISLKLNEVSIENGTIFINQGKGSKDRMIPINSRLKILLSEYLQQRQKFGKKCINFFVSIQKDNPLGESGIKKFMDTLRKKTKIDFSAHTLRHAFARLMLEGGCDIYTLSKLMGHSKITTTTIYLSCSNQQMSKSIEMHSMN